MPPAVIDVRNEILILGAAERTIKFVA